MGKHYEYQVVTHIPEDDEWADQELVSGALGEEAAKAELARPLSRNYPVGTERYLERRYFTDWERL